MSRAKKVTDMVDRTPEDAAAALEAIDDLLAWYLQRRISQGDPLWDDALQEARIRAWDRLVDGYPKDIAVYAGKQAMVDVLRGRPLTGNPRPRGTVDTAKHTRPLTRTTALSEEYEEDVPDQAAVDAYDGVAIRESVEGLLARLTRPQAEAVIAVHLEGRSASEYARELGVTRQAVTNRVNNAIVAMRAHLEES